MFDFKRESFIDSSFFGSIYAMSFEWEGTDYPLVNTYIH